MSDPPAIDLARYYSLRSYLTGRFGGQVAKISLDAGLTCPNRDGTLSWNGCIFCDPKGSGTGRAARGLSIGEQMEEGLARVRKRAKMFIPYFQSFTNTYAPADRLKSMWDLALSYPGTVGLAVGTRPDCVSAEVLEILASYLPDKEVWLELGLQSSNDSTLELINRGHSSGDFARTAKAAKGRGLKVLAHVIIGLPGEGRPETEATAGFISGLGLDGVKVHSLYITKGTGMADLYSAGRYECLTQEDYAEQAVDFLERIPAEMVVHRLTGDPDPKTLLAPEWSLEKQHTLSMIRKRLEELDTWQGRVLAAPRPRPDPAERKN